MDGRLTFASYLGGSGGEAASGIAIDSSGSAYVVGSTQSPDFPTVNAFQSTLNGNEDVFVAKLHPAGCSLVYSTYLGGSDTDRGNAIAVDTAGNAYVTGWTRSTDFPTVNAIQATDPTSNGNITAFAAALSATGSALVYSTYLGGNASDIATTIPEQGNGVAVDAAGNLYLAGSTDSTNFPTANPFQAAYGGGGDAFVAKITRGAIPPTASISPARSINFSSVALGSSSQPLKVTVTNSGDQSLIITSIATTGDYSQSNNCPGSLPPHANNSSCTIEVVFSPTAAGTRPGTLVIADNAANSPQTVTLTGVGFAPPDFSISASPASVTVTPPQLATYTLSLTPLNGFNQAVSLTCTGAPSLATCSISPNPVKLTGTNAATANVSVATTAATRLTPRRIVPPAPGPGVEHGLPMLILGLVLAAGLAASISGRGAGRRRRWARLSLASALLVLIVWASCGGGGGGGGGNPGTPAGTYTLTLTGTYTSTTGGSSLTQSTTVTLVVN